MVVGITFLLRLRGPPAVWKKVVTTVSHCALFELAADEGFPLDDGEGEDEDDDDADGDRERSTITERGRVLVPWDEWGPYAARVISPSSFQWITAHAGQRWLSLESDKLVIRDFSAMRVRRAHRRDRARTPTTTTTTTTTAARRESEEEQEGDGGAADDSEGLGGGATASAPATAGPYGQRRVIWGGSGTCFLGDVVSELPFVETQVDARDRARDMVLTDGERLVAFVRAVSPAGDAILVYARGWRLIG
jgi:hypothetical protein